MMQAVLEEIREVLKGYGAQSSKSSPSQRPECRLPKNHNRAGGSNNIVMNLRKHIKQITTFGAPQGETKQYHRTDNGQDLESSEAVSGSKN